MISTEFVMWLLRFIGKHYCRGRNCECCIFCNREPNGLCHLAVASSTAEKNYKEGKYSV